MGIERIRKIVPDEDWALNSKDAGRTILALTDHTATRETGENTLHVVRRDDGTASVWIGDGDAVLDQVQVAALIEFLGGSA